jgi:hypothetical protein
MPVSIDDDEWKWKKGRSYSYVLESMDFRDDYLERKGVFHAETAEGKRMR